MSRSSHGGGGYGGSGSNDHASNCAPQNGSPSTPPNGGNNCDPCDSHPGILIGADANVDLDVGASLFNDCNLVNLDLGLDADVGVQIG